MREGANHTVGDLRYSIDLGKACARYCGTDLPMRDTPKGRKAMLLASMFLFNKFPWWMPHWWKMILARGISEYWPKGDLPTARFTKDKGE